MKLVKCTLLPFAFIVTAGAAFADNCCPAMTEKGSEVAAATVVPASYTIPDSFPDIALSDLRGAIADGSVVLIDVNGNRSYEKGHIPGAINFAAVDKDGLARALPANKDALIVAYCGGPRCGAYKRAAKVAASLGYSNVKHFSGGISGWRDAGLAEDKG